MRKLRVGLVGRRATSGIAGFRSRPEVEITAFCDLDSSVVATEVNRHGIDQGFTNFDELLDAVDAVALGSPVQFHVPQAVQALAANKHVLSEVPAAVSIDECWRLLDAVRSSEATYMLAENYCYFDANVVVREMVREGLFGEIYFGEGEYVHEVRALHHHADGSPTWRYYWQVGVPGNTYPTHEIGPVMQWFKTQNPDERIDTVICQGTGVHTDPEHPHDDCTITLVKLRSGKLIKLRLDMMSNRPHDIAFSLQGVDGVFESGRGTDARVWLRRDESSNGDTAQRRWRPVSDFLG